MGAPARVDPLLQALQRGVVAAAGSIIPLPPPPAPPRSIRAGQILLGHAGNRDEVGLDLGKLIEGRLLIQGNSGAGKSMLLRRLFEQAHGKVQQLLIDVDGEFSTLADKFDVAVITSADVLRIGGAAFAAHLREHRYSAVLDLSDATAEESAAIVADLATALIEAPPEHWHPMLVLIDESQRLVPRYDPGDVDQETRKRTIRALADLMNRGRKRGLAGVVATSRIAETSTPVVSKPTNIIVGRTVFDRDVDRAGNLLGFTVGQSRPLRSLSDGEFIGIGPALGAGRVRFKAAGVLSVHKGKTPEVEAPPAISAAAAAELLRAVPGAVAEPRFTPPEKADTRGSGRYWSEDEDRIVKDGYANTTKLNDIARQLAEAGYRRRTMGSISMRASALGCRSNSPIAKGSWSPPEDEILIEAYADPDVKIMEIVAMLAAAGFDRGRVSVQMRAIALGITRDRVNYYTEEETAIAKAGLEAGKSNREVIQDLAAAGYQRGVTSISKFAQKHGYDRRADAWTPEEIERLKVLYGERKHTRDIAEELGKTRSAVAAYASKFGLKQRTAWSDDDFQRLEAAWHEGKSLADAAALVSRPYPNVAATAKRIGLNFHIKPSERGKAEPANGKGKRS
ncbi:ATP-binding protein [Bradyrhizobium sp. 4]|uniref:AAA family ATPase n=1 Tax=unclassified Bradyrhizobium TaxID=2631580 RepID=UPI001FFA9E21|nr:MULTISPECIES: AAA family ATPase [unclassified Bradyrhizobium]MCK1401997.1 ATP-binding protein [Bradyrhizobium sp. 39]MCK1751283.1 ATP-binding protein [Bradyrhizobium sp. 135]UPJ38533.1 ATP-binding protein [Bradyrhizobium sp. 4]